MEGHTDDKKPASKMGVMLALLSRHGTLGFFESLKVRPRVTKS